MSLYSLNSADNFKVKVVFIIFIKHSGFITLVLEINIIKIYNAFFINFLNSLNFIILRSSFIYLER
jgi:hypothetical protein